MSGSSLDGVDLAYCEFQFDGTNWKYNLIKAETIEYDNYWLRNLSEAPGFSQQKLQTHRCRLATFTVSVFFFSLTYVVAM